MQSRFGYESFDHVHQTLERFERERLPVHAVVFEQISGPDRLRLHREVLRARIAELKDDASS